MKKIIIIFLFLLSAINLCSENKLKKQILYLNSYHASQKWGSKVAEGIISTLEKSNFEIELHIEYLDTKRYSSTEYLEEISKLIAIKYDAFKFDIILVSDDNAYNFILENRGFFGQDIPIVFCGINYLKENIKTREKGVTGIIEYLEIEKTLSVAKDLYPFAKNVFIINDQTTTGKSNFLMMQDVEKKYHGYLNFYYISDISMSSLLTTVKALDSSSIILLLSFNRDSHGKVYGYRECSEMIASHAQIPVFAVWDFYLGHGVLGGCVLSGEDHGAHAAEIALNILNGDYPDNIPISYEDNHKFKFDYKVMQEFDLETSDFPGSSIFYNKVTTLWDKYKQYFYTFLFIFLFQLVIIIALHANIIKKRKARIALNDLKVYLNQIIDSMPSMIIEVNEEGMIQDWNKQAEKITGLKESEVRNKFFNDVLPQYKYQLNQILKACKHNKVIHLERIPYQQDNLLTYSEMVIYPVKRFNETGAVIRVDDVTSRVKMEQMMIQTEKMISVGGLAAGMAHEINNPLGGIIQSVQNILRRTNPDFKKNYEFAEEINVDLDNVYKYLKHRGIIKFLDSIKTTGNNVSNILSNLLYFSQKGSSDRTLQDLDSIINKTLELIKSDYNLQRKYDSSKINIIKDFDDDIPALRCNPVELEQVFLNIIKNAAEAFAFRINDESNPEIKIIIRKSLTRITIEICDNGPGMTAETKSRLFEPYYTTKAVGSGTGLGLSVSYYIIVNHYHGSIRVESEIGKGSIFIIELPLESSSIFS